MGQSGPEQETASMTKTYSIPNVLTVRIVAQSTVHQTTASAIVDGTTYESLVRPRDCAEQAIGDVVDQLDKQFGRFGSSRLSSAH
jgi:hypothetical protein